MKPNTDLASITETRERVRQFLRDRAVESILDALETGRIGLAEVMQELYLCHSELMLQQEALRESQAYTDQALSRFVQLYRHLPVPALLVSWEGALKEPNAAASALLALDCRFLPQLAVPKDARALEETLREARLSGHATCKEVTLRGLRYEPVIADLQLILAPALESHAPELICTINDQTDRIAQRKALISSSEVVDASTTVAVRWEARPGWPLVYASENVRRWGYPAQAFVSGYVHLIDLIHPEDRAQLEHVFTDAIANKRPHFNLVCRFLWADESVHWAELEISTQRSESDPTPCYQGLIRDVTERELAQIALKQQLRFQELLTEVSSLFANSTHDSLDRVLDDAIARIGHFFRVDRCSILQGTADSDRLDATHAWWASAKRRDHSSLADIQGATPEGWSGALWQERCCQVADAMKLPPEEDALREELMREHIRSRLLAPLHSEGRLIGAFELASFSKPRGWTDEEIRLLRVLGEATASTLVRQVSEQKRRDSERRYQQVSATVTDVAYSCVGEPGQGIHLEWITDSVEALSGYARSDVMKKGCWRFLVVPEDRTTFATSVLGLRPGETGSCELRLRRRDGTMRWVRSTAECVRDSAAQSGVRLYGGLVDITEQKTRETELQRLALVVEQSPSIVAMTDLAGVIEYVNARFCEVTGFTRTEVQGQQLYALETEAMPDHAWQDLRRSLEHGETWRGEIESRKRSGEVFWEQALVTPLRDERGVISHFVKLSEDISDKKALTERLTYLIHYDPLTGLPNRAYMRERIERALTVARRKEHGLALLSIDLDKLKLINDSLGHSAGDELLREVAQRLQSVLGKDDTLARFGGDSFALLLSRVDQVQDAIRLAEQIRSLLKQPVTLGRDMAHITASIGIALYPEDAQSADILISHADAALHKAQHEGRQLYRFYTPTLNEQLREQFQLEQALRRGLERNELVLHYQPRVEMRTGRILSLEALVRWNHPELGLIAPSRFIPLAESTGLILDLGPEVLRQACEQLKRWQAAGVPMVPVAVNLSAKELYQSALESRIQQIVTQARIDATHLELEITESATMHSIDEAVEILSALRQLGFSLSIDDFGTGYASLSYLNRLPMQSIKIDRSFLAKVGVEAEPEPQGAAIVKAIIGLGANLGLHIIAEGVETASQQAFLVEHGCEVAQGYLFSRPLPSAEIETLLRSGHVSTRLH